MLDFLQIFLYQTSILTSQPNKACYFPAKQSMLLCRVFSPSRCISSATTQPAAIVIQMCAQISQCRYNCCVLAITICLLDLCYHGKCSNVLKRNSRHVDLPVILKLRFQPYWLQISATIAFCCWPDCIYQGNILERSMSNPVITPDGSLHPIPHFHILIKVGHSALNRFSDTNTIGCRYHFKSTIVPLSHSFHWQPISIEPISPSWTFRAISWIGYYSYAWNFLCLNPLLYCWWCESST